MGDGVRYVCPECAAEGMALSPRSVSMLDAGRLACGACASEAAVLRFVRRLEAVDPRPWYVEHGDGWALLARMADASVDAVIMDPPYCSGGFAETARRQAKGQGLRRERVEEIGWFAADNMGTSGLVWLLRSVAIQAHRVLKPGGSMICFTDWRQIANLGPALESSGLRWSNLIVWDKKAAGLGCGFRARHELALQYTKGPGAYYSVQHGNVLPVSRVKQADREHQTEKPRDVLAAMIETVAPRGGLVVDPFCGSGSCGDAALCRGVRFAGSDIDPKNAAGARARLQAVQARPELFASQIEPITLSLFPVDADPVAV